MSDATQYSERLRYIGLTAEQRALLAKHRDAIERELPALLDAFYAHLRGWPELAAMFDGEPAMRRAAEAQKRHWSRLFSGQFDDGYFESVRRVGRMHSRIGLEPRWYVGGYSIILSRLLQRLGERRLAGVAKGCPPALSAAIVQAALIDIELATSVYLEENEATFSQRLATLAAAFEEKVGAVTAGIANASGELEGTARALTDVTGKANDRAMTVAAAAEQASAGVQTVAAATEQLSASISVISTQVAESSRTAQRAAEGANHSATVVSALSEAAARVDDVVALIGQIAGKTNMLALNASIEAARAGEAGKAFDVVAMEVKHLADRTAEATLEIERTVRQIHQSSREAVEAMRSVRETIGEVAAIAGAIAEQVEQQNCATQDISRNVQQTALAAHEVSVNIIAVSQAADSNVTAAQQVFGAATDLSGQADVLRREVGAFLSDVRAA